MMTRQTILSGFTKLGKLMVNLGQEPTWTGFESGVTQQEFDDFQLLINREQHHNGWFTPAMIRESLVNLGEQLDETNLQAWLNQYPESNNPRNVAIIMAGNIPLVGFHDFLCVLISGHSVQVKLSSDDKHLLPALCKFLFEFTPVLRERVTFSLGPMKGFDAVIATGSDNSLTYFKQYFGHVPHVFRRNRTSVAILDGNETSEDLKMLGTDVFTYFGLGCRNVSHLLLPMGYDFGKFFDAMFTYQEVIHHKKYGNNYDYNKAVHLLNKVPLLDNNFVLLRESEDLFSPLAMVHYHFYEDKSAIEAYLKLNEEKIQAIVGNGYIPFGQAQCPSLSDYADGVDTMKWLSQLK